MYYVFTAAEYVAWLSAQVSLKRPYWYGTTYVECTESLLARKSVQYPDHYKSDRTARYKADIAAGQMCGDCVGGAIKGAAWSELGTRKSLYQSNGVPDRSADGMFEWCKAQGADWGVISTIPDVPGIAVRLAGHVGVYIGGGYVVEWRGFKYGCVRTELANRKWTHWYQLPWVDYGAAASAAVETYAALGQRLLKKGKTGDDVALLQEALNQLGFDAGEVDGDFGPKTQKAVIRLQARAGIKQDGEYGSESHAALMAMLNEREAATSEPEESSARGIVRVTAAQSAYIREGAGTQYSIITAVKRGVELPHMATAENGWLAVQLDDKTGWISGKMAEVVRA